MLVDSFYDHYSYIKSEAPILISVLKGLTVECISPKEELMTAKVLAGNATRLAHHANKFLALRDIYGF